ncbi:Conserved_hypothetical protein [Hexamita inflata]|uniref:Uncharacterized protein n=1 Tax=Hexamita inflata TaxID=28002 RepID=A0AA86TYV2_9EUKA|nr:Conserved hypothetical protein [Hexamita inflata]CAI9933864.1 Conserved hypothetical protein [Hexamita inflata]
MIHLLLQNQNNIYEQMLNLENVVFSKLNEYSVFNSIEQQIDDPATMFYDPRLFMLPSSYKNVVLLNKFKLRLQSGVSFAMQILNMIINPIYGYPQSYVQAAQYLKASILNDKTDLQNFFSVQQQFINQSLTKFSKFFDDLPENFDETVLSKQTFPSELGRNMFQYVYDGNKSQNYNLPFTSPVPLQKVSKDVVIVLNNFQDSESVFAALRETATVFDRIWFYKVESESAYNNIIQSIFGIEYISLQATLNNYEEISKHFANEKQIQYVQSNQINQILQEVIKIADCSYYSILMELQTNQYSKTVKGEIVMYLFGQENFVQSNDGRQDNFTNDENIHIFFVGFVNRGFQQQQLFHKNMELYIEYKSQSDFLQSQLQLIVKRLNLLYVSSRDEISSVNDSIIVARSIYDSGNQYVGMLLINSFMFETFSDITMNHMDELSATTLKMRIMERQIPIMNPFYQFSQTVSNSSQTLTQTIPVILNKYPQISFNDVASVKLVTIPKIINATAGLFVERFYEYYQVQFVQKALTIHVGLSSTAITTKSRYANMNVSYCTPTQVQQIQIIPLNLLNLRSQTSKVFKRTCVDCAVIDGYNCLIEAEVDLYRIAKQKIVYKPSSDLHTLCYYGIQSTQFTLNTDTNDFLRYLETVPEFGNISQLIIDHNEFAASVLNADNQQWNKIVLKYYPVLPANHNQFLYQDSCVMVIQNNKFVKSSQFTSLVGQQTSSPLLLHILYQKYTEIAHFSKYLQNLEYLLDNPVVKAVYLGHSWISGEEINIANLWEQQTFVYSQTGTNEDQKVVNRVCTEIARLYGTQYFVFSTNPDNNEIVKREQLKSNIDGTNQKFRLSFVNGQTFLTKPLISRNKSVLGIPRVSGYLTLQLDIDNLFSDFAKNTKQFLVMDATGSVLYSQDNSDKYAFGVKQILIKFGYLVETMTNTTIQSAHRSCTRNHDFWDTAFQRSADNEFIVVVSRNTSRFNNILTEEDYNISAVYERSVVFDATSDFFSGGYITVQEFSVLNQFFVSINNMEVITITKEIWQMQRDKELQTFQQNIPQNVSVLNLIYPNLTGRESHIPQDIVRYQFQQVKPFIFEYNWIILILCSLFLLLGIISTKLQRYTKMSQFLKQFNDVYFQHHISVTDLFHQQNLLVDIMLNNQIVCKIQEYKPQHIELTNLIKNFESCLQLQRVNFIFTEHSFTVLEQNQIQALIEDDDQINLFKQLQYEHQELHYRSFSQVQNNPQLYQQFIMNLKNLHSWIPNTLATFQSDLELIKHVQLQYVHSKRFITINNKNVSHLATRLQTALQSRIQSRMHSKPISRQEYVDDIENIPFWFRDSIVRENPSPCQIQDYEFRIFADLSTSIDQLLLGSRCIE